MRVAENSSHTRRSVSKQQSRDLLESLQPMAGLSQMDVTQVPQSPEPSAWYRSILNRLTLEPRPLSYSNCTQPTTDPSQVGKQNYECQRCSHEKPIRGSHSSTSHPATAPRSINRCVVRRREHDTCSKIKSHATPSRSCYRVLAIGVILTSTVYSSPAIAMSPSLGDVTCRDGPSASPACGASSEGSK